VKELHWYSGLRSTSTLVSHVTYRWKHAASCHQATSLPGETDYYEEDDVLAHMLTL